MRDRSINHNSLSSHLFLVVVMTILGIMSMFRGIMIGMDTLSYMDLYSRMTPFSFMNRMEPGYIMLTSVIKSITENPNALIIVTGGITIGLYYIFIKNYSRWYFLSVIFFLCLGFFDSSMNIIRQSLAVAISCIGYKYILKNKIIKFVLIVLLASSFHVTALTVLPVILIRKMPLNLRNSVFIISFFIILYIGFSSILNIALGMVGGYDTYVNSIFGESGKIGVIFQASVYIVLILIVLAARQKIGKQYFKKCGLEFPFYMSLIGVCIALLSYNMSILGRVSQYFAIYLIILVPNALKLLNIQIRYYLAPFAFTCVNIYYWTILLLRPYWNAVYPYTFR